jgi:hypothetical protein
MSTRITTLDLLEKRVHDKIPQAADTNLAAQFTAFLQVFHHDMAKLRNQFQENTSPTTTSPSRKKTKQDVHQPTSPSSLRSNDAPDQGIHQDDDRRHVSPPDGTPDQGDFQGDEMDHELL